MDVHCDYGESTKSILSYDNINCYSRAEDSGYHTSFTPGSLERSDISSDFLDDRSVVTTTAFIDEIQVDYITPDGVYRCNQLKPRNDIAETPPQRRAVKRPHSSIESAKHVTTIPTPTTWIAGKIQSLEVNEDKENATISIPTDSAHSTERNTRFICRLNIREKTYSYPITPVKRNCISPCKKSGRKLDFVIHSLSCEKRELQSVPEQVAQPEIVGTILARPDQKIDILRLLNQKSAIPPLQKIFQYLNNEDICNFCSVSTTWSDIWNSHSTNEKKQEIKQHLRRAKENQENVSKESRVKARGTKLYDGCLKEIHNEINDHHVNKIPLSPQYSPRTNRFRKFLKCASLDSRLQLSCVRCSQPAKVTEEASGEEWVECTSATCSYQFCRSCNCSRHPGKSCIQYDLNAPSPSKRKKCDYAVGTRKSRKNLRRLL
ncbi:F-box only protein 5-like [Trichoplusia ni]|uniref:F-box only protein 5-like n=1 Tax=Trichoplusia ni TaxID=7111 RepID=A0A7E5VV20_TRINI|nr:F-box only protein 5-like [Trichoplusia ni]